MRWERLIILKLIKNFEQWVVGLPWSGQPTTVTLIDDSSKKTQNKIYNRPFLMSVLMNSIHELYLQKFFDFDLKDFWQNILMFLGMTTLKWYLESVQPVVSSNT